MLIARVRGLFSSFRRNFFDSNPLYPDPASHFDLNAFDRRIPSAAVNAQAKSNSEATRQDILHIYELFHKRKFEAFKDKKAQRWSILCENFPDRQITAMQMMEHKKFDSQTQMPLGVGYDQLIAEIKASSFKYKDKYMEGIGSLVDKLGRQSITDLLRLFKRALIYSRAQLYEQKLKGEILKAGIQASVELSEERQRQIKKQALVKAGDQIHANIKQFQQKEGNHKFDVYFGQKKNKFTLQNQDIEGELDRRAQYRSDGEFDIEKGHRLQLLAEIQQRYRLLLNYKQDPSKFTSILKEKGPLHLDGLRDTQVRDQIESLASEMDVFDQAVGFKELKQIEQQLELVLESSPLYFRALIEADKESNNTRFRPTFLDRRLRLDQLAWNELPMNQTLSLDPQDIKVSNSLGKLTDLSPDVKIEFGANTLPAGLFKHPLKEVIRFFASRNPRGKLGHDLEQLDPEERVSYFSTKSNASLDRRNSRTNWTKDGKVFGGGACKKSSAMVYLKPSTFSKVTINNTQPYQYFSESDYRAMALAPLYLGNMQNYEVRLFVRGGGKRGKAQSCQNAMARAIVKLKPELKNYFRHQGMITLDKRNKEPKHLNLYKARRRYPFVRR